MGAFVLFESVLLKLLCQVGIAYTSFTIFAKFGADFLFFAFLSHGAWNQGMPVLDRGGVVWPPLPNSCRIFVYEPSDWGFVGDEAGERLAAQDEG